MKIYAIPLSAITHDMCDSYKPDYVESLSEKDVRDILKKCSDNRPDQLTFDSIHEFESEFNWDTKGKLSPDRVYLRFFDDEE